MSFLDGQSTGWEINFKAKQEEEAQKKMKLHLSYSAILQTLPTEKKIVCNMKLSNLFKKNLFSNPYWLLTEFCPHSFPYRHLSYSCRTYSS